MSGTTMTVRVSGKAYYAALDPKATNVPVEEGWPEPRKVRPGRGIQVVYELTPGQTLAMALHLRDVADSLSYGTDSETRVEGRACCAAARQIEDQIEALA